jgi:hypothetical protein
MADNGEARQRGKGGGGEDHGVGRSSLWRRMRGGPWGKWLHGEGTRSSSIARRRFLIVPQMLVQSLLLGVRVLRKMLLKMVYSGIKPCVVPNLFSFRGI